MSKEKGFFGSLSETHKAEENGINNCNNESAKEKQKIDSLYDINVASFLNFNRR